MKVRRRMIVKVQRDRDPKEATNRRHSQILSIAAVGTQRSPSDHAADGNQTRRRPNLLTRSTTTRYRASSTKVRIPGVDRPLGGESPFVGGPCFAAGNVGSQFRKLVQKT